MTRNIVAIASEAGSAGKTTTLVTLAALLGSRGQRVLVIDTDAQANATKWLGITPEHTTSDVLERHCTVDDAITESTTAGVWGIGSDHRMDATSIALQTARGGEQRMRRVLEDGAQDFDTILIDCPGTVNVVTTSTLIAADIVLTATRPTVKEAQGVVSFEQTVADTAADYRPGLALNGVILCEVPPTNAGRIYVDGREALERSYGELLSPPVRRAASVAEAMAAQQPLTEWAPKAPVTDDYRKVLSWLQDRGVL